MVAETAENCRKIEARYFDCECEKEEKKTQEKNFSIEFFVSFVFFTSSPTTTAFDMFISTQRILLLFAFAFIKLKLTICKRKAKNSRI